MVVCWQKHARVYRTAYRTACNPHQGGSVPLLRILLMALLRILLMALQMIVKPPPSGRAHQALSTAVFRDTHSTD